jgi:hypothetical protein
VKAEQPRVAADRHTIHVRTLEADETGRSESDRRGDERTHERPEERTGDVDAGKRERHLEVVEVDDVGGHVVQRPDLDAGCSTSTRSLLQGHEHHLRSVERRRIEGLDVESLQGEIRQVDPIRPAEAEADHVEPEARTGGGIGDRVEADQHVVDRDRGLRIRAALAAVERRDGDEPRSPERSTTGPPAWFSSSMAWMLVESTITVSPAVRQIQTSTR